MGHIYVIGQYSDLKNNKKDKNVTQVYPNKYNYYLTGILIFGIDNTLFNSLWTDVGAPNHQFQRTYFRPSQFH